MDGNKEKDYGLAIIKGNIVPIVFAACETIIMAFVKKYVESFTEYAVYIFCALVLLTVAIVVNKKIKERRNDPSMNNNIEWVQKIFDELDLANFDYYMEHAIRGLVHEKLFDSVNNLNDLKNLYCWKKKNRTLKMKAFALINSLTYYLSLYNEHCIYTESGFFHEDKFYKSIMPNPNYDKDLESYKTWVHDCSTALFWYVANLNEFISYLNKHFCVTNPDWHSKRLLEDIFGVLGTPNAHFYPTLISMKRELKKSEVKKLRKVTYHQK